MSDFSFWDIVRNLATGLQWTLLLSLVAFIGGGVIGLLVMTLRISNKAFPRNVARTYIELFQGTPLLMQLFLCSSASPCLAWTFRPGWQRRLP